jgi:hypothetical protein
MATDRHSSSRKADKLAFDASAAPAIPEIKAWLSLVGIPKKHAADAHITTEIKAQQSERSAEVGSFPKSAIPYSVLATLG